MLRFATIRLKWKTVSEGTAEIDAFLNGVDELFPQKCCESKARIEAAILEIKGPH